jgi:L-ascorbate metabolism protein UlaG (beta-lactamase superfamily)
LVPVGGHFTIDSFQASKIISTLEPKIVIPMHFKSEDSKLTELADVNVFLHEMGEKNPEKMDSLKLTSSPSNEDIKILILNPNH